MKKKMLINVADEEEGRVAIVEDGLLEEFTIETSSKEQIKGNIYNGVVVKVEPSLQAAFVDYGGKRLVARTAADVPVVADAQVFISLPPERLHEFDSQGLRI